MPPSPRPSWAALGSLGGYLGPKRGQKGCQMEVNKRVPNGAKSRAPTKSGKNEFDTLSIKFEPCPAFQKGQLFVLVLGADFHVKSRSVKSPLQKTALGAQIATWSPPV